MGEDVDPFELFLSWLNPDRGAAEIKYNHIRRRLIVLLDLRGYPFSEDVADEAIHRFIRRLPALADSFTTKDPIPYLYTTAYHVHLEQNRRKSLPLPDDVSELAQPEAEEEDVEEERLHQCLDKCLGGMDEEGRETALAYYQWERREKIECRKALAKRMGISTNALRIKVYHIRNVLQACIEECLGLRPPTETK
jgi:DNA-directed RNA polymerase specialized sigma24 family protein